MALYYAVELWETRLRDFVRAQKCNRVVSFSLLKVESSTNPLVRLQ